MNDIIKDDVIYRKESYEFDLPPHLIAQYPVEPRDHSRLLFLDRQTGSWEDRFFYDLGDYLKKGDTLVLNNTRVIPARLFGIKESGARVEILLLAKRGPYWESLVRPAKRLKCGHRILFPEDPDVEVEIIEELEDGGRILAFHCQDENAFIEKAGRMPLPPYINRPAEAMDTERYQTVYAQVAGSAAAPTAGLHFTEDLLTQLKGQGIQIANILLHVGLGTFRPVSSEDIRQHHMHFEYYQMDQATASLLNDTRKEGGRIIAVGTTVVRTLETIYNEQGGFKAQNGQTDKFIYPGYDFHAIDGMITNFHLPASSLMMLVSAFAGLANTRAAYRHAVESEYRFFSYGDAMLIL